MRYIVWLDDIRNPFMHGNRDRLETYMSTYDYNRGITTRESDWALCWVQNSEAFEDLMERLLQDPDHKIGVVSFDNDLGFDSKEGRECFSWMERLIHEKNITKPFEMWIHSGNPSATKNMNQGVAALHKFWEESK